MKLEQINKELAKIKSYRMIDYLLPFPNKSENEDLIIPAKSVELLRDIIDLYKKIRWHVSFNHSKRLEINHAKETIIQSNCGSFVKVRPCDDDKGKTYFGIYLGDVALSVTASIHNRVTKVEKSFYNPAIYIPSLKRIVYGMNSWWSRIDDDTDLEKEISDDLINNQWYMQMLKKETDR